MTYDLAIIGAGFAGQAAKYFAKKKGLSVCLIGKDFGASVHFSGVFDLVSPVALQKHVDFDDFDSPEQTYKRYLQFFENHPYQKCDLSFESLFDSSVEFLESLVPLQKSQNQWQAQIQASGKLKPCLLSMQGASLSPQVLQAKGQVLLVDWLELTDYNASLISKSLTDFGFQVRTHSAAHKLNPTSALMSLVQQMDDDEFFQNFVTELRAFQNIDVLVLPPVLGIYKYQERIEALQKELSCEVVEMQNRLPSVAGLRLDKALAEHVDIKGKVTQVQDGSVVVGDQTIQAKQVLLTTGKYVGGGLKKEPLWQESLLNLPLSLENNLVLPHRTAISMIDPKAKDSQAFMRLGVSVNSSFQPCDPASEQVLHPNLFVSGHLLPDFDYTREFCGVGVSVATSYKVIEIIE